jgi:hypothetical protein
MRKLIVTGFVLCLVGCASPSARKGTEAATVFFATEQDIAVGNFSVVKVCRPRSVIRPFESPDLRVNGNVIGEISNGALLRAQVKPAVNIDFFLGSSALLYRFRDEVLFSLRAARNENRNFVLQANANVIQGLTVAIGGAVAESVRQSDQSSSGNWSVREVTDTEFGRLCPDKK